MVLLLATNLLALLVVFQQPADAWWFQSSVAAPARALASFNMEGVNGTFKFTQQSPSEPTTCEYELTGLKGNNNLYHVHVRPVPYNHDDPAKLCGDPATGGHLNPHNITVKLPPKSASLDKYELGDLSGKHGPLLRVAGAEDRYMGSFTDDKLPMFGEHSIVGRSIVIHKNGGQRWVCASIVEIK